MIEWYVPKTDEMAMAKAYPTWRQHSLGKYGGWEGLIQPLPPGSDLRGVLGAIWHGQELAVQPGGALTPVNPGSASNLPGWLRRVKGLNTTFRVRIYYGDPSSLPFAISLKPLISWRRYPHHPHLYYGNGSPDLPAVLCPFLPSDKAWVPGENDIAEYLHLVAIWLVCHQVYELTKKWPAKAASHDPAWLVANVDARATPCVCGRPVPYEDCCRRKHLWQLQLRRAAR